MTDEDKCVIGIYGCPADISVISITKDGRFLDSLTFAEAQRINDQEGGWTVVGQPYKMNQAPPRLEEKTIEMRLETD